MIDQLPSRFLHEIPNQLVPLEDCSYWSLAQVNQFCASWLNAPATKTTSDVYIPSFAKASADKPKATTHKPTKTLAKPAKKMSPQQETITNNSSSTSWKKNQPVKHAKYGVGTIESIEEKATGDTHLTVRFKVGIKKIVAQFLQRL